MTLQFLFFKNKKKITSCRTVVASSLPVIYRCRSSGCRCHHWSELVPALDTWWQHVCYQRPKNSNKEREVLTYVVVHTPLSVQRFYPLDIVPRQRDILLIPPAILQVRKGLEFIRKRGRHLIGPNMLVMQVRRSTSNPQIHSVFCTRFTTHNNNTHNHIIYKIYVHYWKSFLNPCN